MLVTEEDETSQKKTVNDVSIPLATTKLASARKVQKILIDPAAIQFGVTLALSLLVNCILLFGLMMLIPQTQKNRLQQTYNMGYAIGVNCGNKDPSRCIAPCFEMLSSETSGASCAAGVQTGWRERADFESWK